MTPEEFQDLFSCICLRSGASNAYLAGILQVPTTTIEAWMLGEACPPFVGRDIVIDELNNYLSKVKVNRVRWLSQMCERTESLRSILSTIQGTP